MKYALGIDGGGTKTNFILSDFQGNIVSETKTAGIDFNYVRAEGVKDIIKSETTNILTNVGCELTDIRSVCAGIPCYGESKEWDRICFNFFCEYFDKAKVKCVNDVEVGLYGSLAIEAGIHLVAGTGSIAFGIDNNGKTARSGGWNEHFSDEGSCYWLGLKLCELFSKQSDYRVAKGPLYDIVKAELNISEDFELINYFKNNLLINREKMANIQRLLEKSAIAGDISAIESYKEAAYELSLCVRAVYVQLQLSPHANVSYSGGLFKSGRLILTPLNEYLKDMNIFLLEPKLTPIEGALLYAIANISETDKNILVANIKSHK